MSQPDTKCVYGHTQQTIMQCANMRAVEGDNDMEYEHYYCPVCGKREKLDYEEMR